MKLIQHENSLFSITEIHPNDLNLIQTALKSLIQLSENIKLDALADEQTKLDRIEKIKSIVTVLSSIPNSKTAESWDETILKKIVEKCKNAN